MKTILPALSLLLPFAGCVSAAKLKASEAKAADARALSISLSNDLNAARGQAFALQGALKTAEERGAALAKSEADLKTRQAELETKLASTAEQVASLQKSNQDLQQSLEANKGELSRKVSDLVKEKDAAGQKLASAQASAAEAKAVKERELAEAARRAAEAEARGRTLEASLKDLEGRLAALETQKAELQRQKDAEVAAVTKSYEDIAAGLKAEISAGEVTISSLKGRLTVNLVDRILFDSGSAEVKPAGRKVLARVGALLNEVKDKDIRIEGHTDNVPIKEDLRERYASNWELSTARATAVTRYLEDQAKVDPARLVAAGLGQWRPVAPNDKPENRALNRRIEIILVPRE